MDPKDSTKDDTEEMNRFNRETADLDDATRKQVSTLTINGVHNKSECKRSQT